MRVILILFFCFQLSNLSFAQSTAYFNKIISSISGTSSIVSVVVSDTNYFLVIDNIAPGQNKQHTMYLLVNTHGVIVDSAMYQGIYKHSMVFPANTALRTNSGKYLVATSRIDTSNAGCYSVLVCLDNNLDTLWTRKYTHPDTLAATQPGAYIYNVHTAIRQTWDGGFIITGNYSKNCDQNQMRSYLLKTDSMGVMEWIKKYNNIAYLYTLRISPDSGYFFPTVINGKLSVVKTDPWGDIQWSVKVNSNSNPSYPMDLAIQDDSNLVVVSSFWYDLTWNFSAITVAKVNFVNPTKIWEKNYYLFRNFKCIDVHQSVSMHTLPDASIVIGGTSKVYDPKIWATSEYKGVMMKLSPNGDSLWARYYGYGPFNHGCQFEHMIPTADAGFLAVGYYYPLAPSRPWLVKMDSLGCDTPGCHLISIEETGDRGQGIEVFPNPFGDEMHIVLPEEFGVGMLVLYDVNGCKALETRIQTSVTGQDVAIQTGSLKPGMYLLEISGKDGRIWRRKVMKH